MLPRILDANAQLLLWNLSKNIRFNATVAPERLVDSELQQHSSALSELCSASRDPYLVKQLLLELQKAMLWNYQIQMTVWHPAKEAEQKLGQKLRVQLRLELSWKLVVAPIGRTPSVWAMLRRRLILSWIWSKLGCLTAGKF